MVMPPETGKRTPPGQMELVAAILMGGLGITQVVAMPLLATLIASAFQIEGADSGLIGLANLLGTALGSLIVTIWLHHLPLRRTVIVSALIAVAAQIAVAVMAGFTGIILLEAVSGIGAGVLIALSAAIVGASANPDRGFAFILTLQAGVAVLVLLVIPVLAEAYSLLEVMIFLASTQALLIPVGLTMRYGPIAEKALKTSEASGSPVQASILLRAASYFVFSAAVGVLWVFSGILGSMAEIDDAPLGHALAFGNVAAIAGSLLAAIITSRFGRISPILAVCLTLALSALLFAADMTLIQFYLASSLFLFAWGGGLPLLMGSVAAADATDRVTSLLPVLAFAGMGVGPALVGIVPGSSGLFQQVSYTTIGLVALAFCLLVSAHTVARLRKGLG
ncbi:MFS transporter [Henriciella litoralis]|uniref:MFS transporter n=1 Tax=Henriciella litoralis TaxID=568102 RepID=UPI00111C740C|nr:MFS transporter [Henriciella litoralis]